MFARLLLIFAAAVAAGAQAPQGRVLGAVTAVSVESKEISVRADSGQVYRAKASDDTQVLRAEPGEPDISKAAQITLSGISVGDRLLVRGQVSESDYSVAARLLVVMSKDSIASKQAKEQAEWRARSIAGLVKAVDAPKREITITARSMAGPKEWVVAAQAGTSFRRYAENSAKFADAAPSAIEAILPGDQLRVLGNRDETASRITAEAAVFGSFRTLAGEITSVRPEAGEVTITDLQTKKPVVVRVSSDTTVRRMPEFAGTGFPGARMQGTAPVAGPGGNAPLPGASPGSNALRGGAPAGGPPDIQRMIERMPAVPLSQLKAGDAVILSAMKGADDRLVTAITLVAGMDFLLRSSQVQVNQTIANWNLDIGVP